MKLWWWPYPCQQSIHRNCKYFFKWPRRNQSAVSSHGNMLSYHYIMAIFLSLFKVMQPYPQHEFLVQYTLAIITNNSTETHTWGTRVLKLALQSHPDHSPRKYSHGPTQCIYFSVTNFSKCTTALFSMNLCFTLCTRSCSVTHF